MAAPSQLRSLKRNPPLSTRALPPPLLAQLAALTPAELHRLTLRERLEIDASLAAHERAEGLTSHRAFCESPHWCNLTLSPLMAAVMDAAEGRPVTTIDDDQALRHFGCIRAELPQDARRLVAARAGGRAGKSSRMLATKSIFAALTVPLLTLNPGERAMSLLIAPDLYLAHQTLGFVKGYAEASPALRSRVLRETADELELLRPDELPVTIRVRAASRGGRGGRGFVLVFAGLDEAAFFRDESSGVVNDLEIYRAVAPRLAPGAQCWIASTPWVASIGLLEETIGRDFGTHTHALCVTAPTRALNPTWDPDGSIEAALREEDPDNADREIGAIPLAQGSTLFFDKVAIDAAVDAQRPLDLPYDRTKTYGAAGDFAFRRNSSALAITARTPAEGDGVDRFALAFLDERRPEKGVPLKPSAVCDDFAEPLHGFELGEVAADSHERDDVAEEMARHDVTVVPLPEGQKGKAEQYLLTRKLLREGRLTLPKHDRFLRQLRAVTAKAAPGGGLSISSPQTADGAHGDLVSAFVGSVWKAVQGARVTEAPEPPDAITLHTDY